MSSYDAARQGPEMGRCPERVWGGGTFDNIVDPSHVSVRRTQSFEHRSTAPRRAVDGREPLSYWFHSGWKIDPA